MRIAVTMKSNRKAIPKRSRASIPEKRAPSGACRSSMVKYPAKKSPAIVRSGINRSRSLFPMRIRSHTSTNPRVNTKVSSGMKYFKLARAPIVTNSILSTPVLRPDGPFSKYDRRRARWPVPPPLHTRRPR